MGFRIGISEAARLSVFWERILRFSQAKILGFFLWLSAKNFKSAFRICICSRTSVFSGIFVTNQNFFVSIDYNCKNSLLFKRYDKEAVDRISFCEIVSRAFFVFKQKSRSRQRSRRYPRLLRLYLRPFLSWSV